MRGHPLLVEGGRERADDWWLSHAVGCVGTPPSNVPATCVIDYVKASNFPVRHYHYYHHYHRS
jgi:hypothetical protein